MYNKEIHFNIQTNTILRKLNVTSRGGSIQPVHSQSFDRVNYMSSGRKNSDYEKMSLKYTCISIRESVSKFLPAQRLS